MTKPVTKPVKLDQDAAGKQKIEDQSNELRPEDFYYEGPYMVFTAAYHLKRGYCCNSKCRHCPYGTDGGLSARIELSGLPVKPTG